MQSPILSVIVCTYNREKYIGECLAHLANQSVNNSDYEVLVVNNNSKDMTNQRIRQVIKDNPVTSFHYYIEKQQGLSIARNKGILKSNGKIISFVDDDAFVNVQYCEKIIAFFKEHKAVAAMGGKIIPQYETNEPDWMSKYLLPLVAAIDKGKSMAEFSGSSFPIGANMAFRKSVFDAYGLFDIDLGRRGEFLESGEEKELFLRLKNRNEKILYNPEVVVRHIIPPHRVENGYIKALAIGIGKSERKRISKNGLIEILNKIASEVIKTVGTFIIAIGYLLKGYPLKAVMLVKFRYWVVTSLIKG